MACDGIAEKWLFRLATRILLYVALIISIALRGAGRAPGQVNTCDDLGARLHSVSQEGCSAILLLAMGTPKAAVPTRVACARIPGYFSIVHSQLLQPLF